MINEEEKLVKITLSIPKEMKTTWRTEAAKQNLSLSAWIRILINKELSKGVE